MKKLECECGRVLGYEPRHAGKKVKCSGCGKALTVPEDKDAPLALLPDDEPEPAPLPRPSRVKRGRDEEEPRRRSPAMEDDEDFDDEPRRSRREKNDTAMNAFANFLVEASWIPLVLAVAGCICVPIAIYQGALSSRSSSTAQAVSLAEIESKDPDSLYVTITGARAGTNSVVLTKIWKSRRSGAETSRTNTHFVPLLRAGAPEGGAIRVLLKSDAEQSKLNEILARGEYKGLIVNSITSLDSETQRLLREKYPATDFSRVLILEEGRAPWSSALVMTLFLGGIFGVAVGLALWLVMGLYRTV